jgi:hypothetical protein
MTDPVYTFVLTSRNDDHDPGLKRLHTCLYALFGYMERIHRPSELILVEWNPPPDRPPLADAIRWPTGQENWTARVITVPPEVHAQWKGGKGGTINLFVLAARNVGIRRAEGAWVLPLNQDTFFSDSLAWYLGPRHDLDPRKFYRAIRVDIKPGVPWPTDLEGLSDYAYNNVTKAHLSAGGDSLFFNGSGDFMLMSRAAWHATRGYTEERLYGLYLDSAHVVMVHLAGYIQEIIPAPAYLYHIEHPRGWTSSGYRGLAEMGYQYANHAGFRARVERMQREGWAAYANGDLWGQADQDLPERVIHV